MQFLPKIKYKERGNTMEIKVCIGSRCHQKGSKTLLKELKKLIAEHHLEQAVALSSSFCMDVCQQDIGVSVDGRLYSVKLEEVGTFFEENVRCPLEQASADVLP